MLLASRRLVMRADESTDPSRHPVGVADDDPDIERVRAVLESRLLGVPETPARIGRFVVIERVGAGGMGVVYAAFDPQLDRKVAIKLLSAARTDAREQARLLAEAKAMAQLAHPNVASVFEVGELGGRVFVAMEYVRGRTLKQWTAERSRTWRELWAVWQQAGRGLAAAHAAGIVHRDFKPDNVLVGDDERARVLDFGLARATAVPSPETHAFEAADSGEGATLTRLTRTGAVLGTPAYMAPEQIRGERVDARADQFSFCLAMWEAFAGQRPFAGDSVQRLFEHVLQGELIGPPRGAMPSGIEAALRRGLSPAPGRRYASMDALLVALERGIGRRRRTWLVVGGVAAVAATAAVTGFAALAWRARDQPEPCPPAQTRLAGVWDDDVRARIAARYGGMPERPYVSASAASFSRAMSSLAEDWSEAYDSACAASHSTDETERRLAMRRLECLDSAVAALSVFVENASVADPEAYARSYVGEFGLHDLATCRIDAIVRRLPALPSDPALANEVAAVRREIQWSLTRITSGELATGLTLAEAVVERAKALDYPPVHAEALAALGLAKLSLQHPDARAVLTEAVHAGEAAGHDLATLDALQWLARIDERAPELLERIDAIVQRIGAPADARFMASFLRVVVSRSRGDADGARALAREIAETWGDDAAIPAQRRAMLHTTLAELLFRPGDGPASVAAAQRAVDIYDEELGPGHPRSAPALGLVAAGLADSGDFTGAIARYERLHEMLDAIHEDGHLFLAVNHLRHGGVLLALGRTNDARAHWERADEMFTRLVGAEHGETRLARAGLLQLALSEGDVQAARAIAAPLRRISDGVLGVTVGVAAIDALDGKVAEARAGKNAVLAALGRLRDGDREIMLLAAAYVEFLLGDRSAARAHAEEAMALPRPLGYRAGAAPAMAGWLYVEAGDHERALPLLEQAVDEAAKVETPDVAWYSPIAHFALAIALDETGGDRDRAVRSATIALAHAGVTGPARTGVAEKAAAWLAARAR